MRKIGVVLALACFLFCAGLSLAEEAVDAGNKVCPVTGEQVDPNVTYEYQGKIYHFCCSGCIAPFQKDPQKYIKKIKE